MSRLPGALPYEAGPATQRYYGPRCDRCGRFVGADALVISEFIPPPREGMEDHVFCERCATSPEALKGGGE